jgi:PIN domain nuclease of toxin-antitoxin system
MQEQLKQYPEDVLIANNSAWLAVKCGFEIDRAMELSKMVTDRFPSDTYLDTLAEVHFVQGKVDRAIEISLECHKLNPRDPHHRRQLQRYRASRLAPK